MAEAVSPSSILQQIYEANQRRMEALQQPAPQQGGILSGADPVMLALASGLLSPTKAGSFGESIGQGLSAAAGPLSEMRKQEAARADKIAALQEAQAKLAMDMYDVQTGGRRGGNYRDPALNAKIWGDMADQLESQAFLIEKKDPQKYEELKNQAAFLRKKAASIAGYGEDEAPASTATKDIKTQEQKKEEPPSTPKKEDTRKTIATPYTGDSPPPQYPNAKKAGDGYWYVQGADGKWNQRVKVSGQ